MKLIEFIYSPLNPDGRGLSNETSSVAIAPTEVKRIEKCNLSANGQKMTIVTVAYNRDFHVIGSFSEVLKNINEGLK